MRRREYHVHLVTVFASGDKAKIVVAKSVLDAAGIPYVMKGEILARWIPLVSLGLVEIQVRWPDADEACELLEDLKKDDSGSGVGPGT